MAIVSKNIININDINTEFTQKVINTILSDAYDINNVPMDGSYYCIEPDKLGNKDSLPTPNVGSPNTLVSAINIYNNLVSLTTVLTRVGTFSYIRTYQVNSSIQTQYSLSGKALFNTSYIKSLPAVPSDTIAKGKVINSADINTLFANLLAAWNTAAKHHNTVSTNLCHTNCHSNCHSDCHSNGGCYK